MPFLVYQSIPNILLWLCPSQVHSYMTYSILPKLSLLLTNAVLPCLGFQPWRLHLSNTGVFGSHSETTQCPHNWHLYTVLTLYLFSVSLYGGRSLPSSLTVQDYWFKIFCADIEQPAKWLSGEQQRFWETACTMWRKLAEESNKINRSPYSSSPRQIDS